MLDIQEERRKAQAGSCVAKNIVGISYLFGCDVEVDYQQAFLQALRVLF